ncbi:MAG: NUDIX domain-containing protein, partial [Caulobacteraceae bacterium]
LMDLGATICRPTSPLCDRCPVSSHCRARASGAPAAYPRKTRRAERPQRFGIAYVIHRGGDVAVVRRPTRGLLGGMLGLPSSDWTDQPNSLTAPEAWTDHGAVHHVFTHFALNLRVLAAKMPEASKMSGSTNLPGQAAGERLAVDWMPMDVALAAMPTLFKKALGRVLD